MRFTLTACVLALATTPPLHAQNDAAYRERVRFDTCLGRVQIDATDALERAQAWRIEGGGWPAEVCEARALIALGEGEIGADILVNLADGTAIGMVDAERTELLTLAGDTRFMAGQLDDAAAAYDAALALQPDDVPARLARAGLHAGRNDWAALSTDAERLIEIAPWLAAGWRYRGQVRLAAGEFDLAWQDMQRAREQEPDDIPTLLLRGAILEARRQAAAD